MNDLVEAARDALENAHAPYSKFFVGAAIRTADGSVFTGCNIENSNYSNSLHAEEVALSAAIKRGYRDFEAIAVTSGERDGVTPCGLCRQTLAEFCDGEFVVYTDHGDTTREYTLAELLPEPMSGDRLDRG